MASVPRSGLGCPRSCWFSCVVSLLHVAGTVARPSCRGPVVSSWSVSTSAPITRPRVRSPSQTALLPWRWGWGWADVPSASPQSDSQGHGHHPLPPLSLFSTLWTGAFPPQLLPTLVHDLLCDLGWVPTLLWALVFLWRLRLQLAWFYSWTPERRGKGSGRCQGPLLAGLPFTRVSAQRRLLREAILVPVPCRRHVYCLEKRRQLTFPKGRLATRRP